MRRTRFVKLGVKSVAAAAVLAISALPAWGAKTATVKPVYDGVLNIGINNNPICMDPRETAVTATWDAVNPAFETLTDLDPKTHKVVPWLAKSWQVKNKGATYIFNLKAGVKFSNGQGFDADVEVANLNNIIQLGALASRGQTFLQYYSGSKAIGKYKVEVDFKVPQAAFLAETSNPGMSVVAPASLNAAPSDLCQGKNLYGSGPYTITSYVPNQTVTLDRRDDYGNWGSALNHHTGKGYLKEIIVHSVVSSAVSDGSLQSGQLDAALNVSQQDYYTLTSAGFSVQVFPNPGVVQCMAPNMSHSIMQDDAVREAIQHAIDRAAIIKALYVPRTPVPTSILASTTLGYVNESANMKYDPALAKSILDKAGWVVGSDGIRVKNGVKLQLTNTYAVNTSPLTAELTLIQQELADIGIGLTLHGSSAAQVRPDADSGVFDFAGCNGTLSDPDILRSVFGLKGLNSDHISVTGPGKEFVVAVAKQSQAYDPAKRLAYVKAIQDMAIKNAYAIPINPQVQVLGINPKVHGIRFNGTANFALYDTWIG